MIGEDTVVIQCAGRKIEDAPSLRGEDGRSVSFVAQPELAPDDGTLFARPDDRSDDGTSWRQRLRKYNHTKGSNPLELIPAARLYSPPIYGSLAAKLPASKLFILSAGWGLIRSDFLTPAYDITFSAQAKQVSRRKKSADYKDFCCLELGDDQPLLFFGGKDYLKLFCCLTHGYRGKRTVFYNSANPPKAPDCALQKFETKRRTNWHYECAQAYLDGRLKT